MERLVAPAGGNNCTIHFPFRLKTRTGFPQFRSVVPGRLACRVQKVEKQTFDAGPKDPGPDYTQVDGNPINEAILQEFRKQMVVELGKDSEVEG